MKNRLFALTIFFFIFLLSACTKKTDYYLMQFHGYFDTAITIKVYSEKKLSIDFWKKEAKKIEAILIQLENTFSRTKKESELYKLNQTAGIAPFKASDLLFDLVIKSMDLAELSKGKFDPTVGVLVDAWGINTKNEDWNVLSQEEINNLMPLVGYKQVVIDKENQTVYLPKKNMVLDLGAIAKGYAADLLAEKIKEMGYNHALINLGGNVIVVGERYKQNEDKTYDWKIGLRNPKFIDDIYTPNTPTLIGVVSVIDKTVVSSGTYERYWFDEATNKFYHHLIDPYTGYPVGTEREYPKPNDLEAVTIITSSSTNADALSTAIFCLGIEEGLKFVETLDDVEAVFITYDKQMFFSSNFIEKYKFVLE